MFFFNNREEEIQPGLAAEKEIHTGTPRFLFPVPYLHTAVNRCRTHTVTSEHMPMQCDMSLAPMSAASAALRLVRGELPRDVSDSPMQPAGVYFNHMRKAAGSTTGSTTIAWFQHIGQARNFYVTAMEFSFFASTAWLTCHPSSFVVVPLREPISRHVSEYHHAGPPYRCQTTPIRDTACFAAPGCNTLAPK